jgi:hypothetical protein
VEVIMHIMIAMGATAYCIMVGANVFDALRARRHRKHRQD